MSLQPSSLVVLSARAALLKMAQETQCAAFQLKALPSPYQLLNGQLFIVPNAAFLERLRTEKALRGHLGLNLVSLMGDLSEPLPFDKGHPYVDTWKQAAEQGHWDRNCHLWLRIWDTLFNNSLARFQTFEFPGHLHVSSWSERPIDSKYPYAWMNLMVETLLFFPPQMISSLEKLMRAMVVDSFVAISKLGEWKAGIEIPEGWEKVLAFSLPENRRATYEHLSKHDGLWEAPVFSQEDLPKVAADTDRLPFIPFSVLSKPAEAGNLLKMNCLNLFFLLGNEAFLKLVEKRLGREEADRIRIFSGQLFRAVQMPDGYVSTLQRTSGATYNTGELLWRSWMSPHCPAVLLEGAHPAQARDLSTYRLPLNIHHLGLPDDLAALLNSDAHRELVSVGVVPARAAAESHCP